MEVREELHNIVAVETITAVIHMIYKASGEKDRQEPNTMGPSPVMMVAAHSLRDIEDPTLNLLSLYELNRWTTIPLPSDKTWREETAKDTDLVTLKRILETKSTL